MTLSEFLRTQENRCHVDQEAKRYDAGHDEFKGHNQTLVQMEM